MFRKMFVVLCLVAMMFSQAVAQNPPKTCAEARAALDAQIAILNTLQLQRASYEANLSTILSRLNAIDAELNYQVWGPGFGDCQECQDLKQDLLGQLEGLHDAYDLMTPWLDSQDVGKNNEWLVGQGIQALESDLLLNSPECCTDVYYSATGWMNTLAMQVMGWYLDRISQSNNLLDDADELLDAVVAGCECEEEDPEDPC